MTVSALIDRVTFRSYFHEMNVNEAYRFQETKKDFNQYFWQKKLIEIRTHKYYSMFSEWFNYFENMLHFKYIWSTIFLASGTLFS